MVSSIAAHKASLLICLHLLLKAFLVRHSVFLGWLNSWGLCYNFGFPLTNLHIFSGTQIAWPPRPSFEFWMADSMSPVFLHSCKISTTWMMPRTVTSRSSSWDLYITASVVSELALFKHGTQVLYSQSIIFTPLGLQFVATCWFLNCS